MRLASWSCLGLLALGAVSAETVFDVSAPARPEGAPRASDVIMRSLTKRVRSDKSPYDTLQALQDFHATRLEWTYITEPAFIAKVHALGRSFGGAVSAPTYDPKTGGVPWQEVCIKDLNGEIVIAPWKRTWQPTLWGCVNNPALERGYLAALIQAVEAGADVMQRDEMESNASAVNWGACFCDDCMTGFREWLGRHTTAAERKGLGIDELATFDYRVRLKADNAPVGDAFRNYHNPLRELFAKFQHEATVAYNARTRAALNQAVGRRVPMSCNNGVSRSDDVVQGFDWYFGELWSRNANAPYLHTAMQRAVADGRIQIATMPKQPNRDDPPGWTHLTRSTIAWCYAFGGYCMVPWDVYMPSDTPRYFGTPTQYADLFGFIRANAALLDDLAEAAVSGPGLPAATQPPVTCLAEDVVTVLRVVPGQPSQPAALHLIDSRQEPEPTMLQLDPARFYGDRPFKLRLKVPAKYDAAQHQQAEQTGDFGALAQDVALPSGYLTQVSLPALRPWGIAVIEPGERVPGAVWQPAVVVDAAEVCSPTPLVKLSCATAGAAIHFTLDGTEPTAQSARYEQPFEVTRETVIRAIAVNDGRSSLPARLRLSPIPGAPQPLRPDAPALQADLALWLQAGSLKGLDDGDPLNDWPAAAGLDLNWEPHKLHDGRLSTPPVYRPTGLNGRPAIELGETASWGIPDFSNQQLAGHGFTVMMVTQSDDAGFGLTGNGLGGQGGIPRLYLQRGGFCYNLLRPMAGIRSRAGEIELTWFSHDGQSTISGGNGEGQQSVPDVPLVKSFGGGNLACPLWGGDQPHAGLLSEVVVYRRALTAAERNGVLQNVAVRYGLPAERLWRASAE